LTENGDPYRRTTAFWCVVCHMPLCSESRRGHDGGRIYDCLEEHQTTTDREFYCGDVHTKGTGIGKNKLIQLHPRRGARGRR
jgi:hypothetical protein